MSAGRHPFNGEEDDLLSISSGEEAKGAAIKRRVSRRTTHDDGPLRVELSVNAASRRHTHTRGRLKVPASWLILPLHDAATVAAIGGDDENRSAYIILAGVVH